ncbi:hypothetical protein [Actinomadura rugatobispora]|uniref:Uncharacterized protein n=1 Tax=Actinomadura rugatobispora TaxID=1994 RepID=A0ABW1AAW1_9ACTN|nr:hypothetical protein GCM10010200_041530 [Actinomadura rugatobispora]
MNVEMVRQTAAPRARLMVGHWRAPVAEEFLLTLAELVDQLARVADGLTVYAEEPWTAGSRVVAAKHGDGLSPVDLPYLLEVVLIREVLDVWSSWRAGARPTTEEACAAIIHYAQYDAYLPPAT